MATQSATKVIIGNQTGIRSVTIAKSINLFHLGKATASSSRERIRKKRGFGIAAINPCHFGNDLMTKTSNLGGLFFSVDLRVWRSFAQPPLHCDYPHNWVFDKPARATRHATKW